MSHKKHKNSLWKVIATDFAGVIFILLVPFLGPLPGPGGIPLLLAGFGLLAINHDWADGVIVYIKKRSESLRNILFPRVAWVELAWDIAAIILISGGVWLNFVATNWPTTGMSIAIMATAMTVFVLNRDRITRLEKALRSYGRK
jgi:membrane protease YdiL (CAAX protease family)